MLRKKLRKARRGKVKKLPPYKKGIKRMIAYNRRLPHLHSVYNNAVTLYTRKSKPHKLKSRRKMRMQKTIGALYKMR